MKNSMKKFATCILPISILSACSSTQTTPEMQLAQSKYENLDKYVMQKHAPLEYKKASDAWEVVSDLSEQGADEEKLNHYSYLSQKRSEIALAVAEESQAKASIESAEVRRKDVLLEKRDEQLTEAELVAQQQKIRAELLEDQTEELSEQYRERGEQLTEAQLSATEQEMRADLAEQRYQDSTQKLKTLESELEEVKTQQTDRGMILTLNNIVFDLNKAALKPGAETTLDRVADFLREYQNRQIIVEGFTDSTGTDAYNKQLSEKRAAAVKDYLVTQAGISASRINAEGYGEEFPVANNDTRTGRQLNRRVEIVVANEDDQPVSDRLSANN